jgi:dihydroorotase-like cyclic amidohydrolase
MITLFEPATIWTVTNEGRKSKSANTPFTGTTLTGKVKGIINGTKTALN